MSLDESIIESDYAISLGS